MTAPVAAPLLAERPSSLSGHRSCTSPKWGALGLPTAGQGKNVSYGKYKFHMMTLKFVGRKKKKEEEDKEEGEGEGC